MKQRNLSAARPIAQIRILRINAALNCTPVRLDIFLLKIERKSRSDADLPFDQIDPCHHLCYGMFHLKARIHFHKIEILLIVH